MYFALCLVAGFVYFRTGKAWRDVYSRTALLFYVRASAPVLCSMLVALMQALLRCCMLSLR